MHPADPLGSLTPAEAPLIEAEKLSEQAGPPQYADDRAIAAFAQYAAMSPAMAGRMRDNFYPKTMLHWIAHFSQLFAGDDTQTEAIISRRSAVIPSVNSNTAAGATIAPPRGRAPPDPIFGVRLPQYRPNLPL
jgi:hypothetical protein